MLALFLLTLLHQTNSKINLFIVPHSHNDAGWLIDVNDCYITSCKNTLDNIFSLLQTQPSLKFCWSEIIFLSRWLSENPQNKPQLLQFIQQGRFEIIGGGWVQHDEALPDFELVLRQMESGFEFLKRELNITSISIGWQLDPFGHSTLTPALFSKLGIKTLVFGRIFDEFYKELGKNKDLEFIWKTQGFNDESRVFAHVLPYYGFLNFIHFYPNAQVQTPVCYVGFKDIDEMAKNCLRRLEMYIVKENENYKTQNQLLLLGDDFAYTDLNRTKLYFELWEKIIEKSENMAIQFATPSEYFKAVFASKSKFSTYEGDFLPFVNPRVGREEEEDITKAVWTGFYTTKPHLKKTISDLQKQVRNAELLATFLLDEKVMAYELATCTHHDAITGTCKFDVYMDYLKRLEKEKFSMFGVIGKAFEKIFNYRMSTDLIVPYKILIVFNSLNWKVRKTVKFKIDSEFVVLKETSGEVIQCQIVEVNKKFYLFFNYELKSTEAKVLFVELRSSGCEECNENSTVSQKPTFGNAFLYVTMKDGLIFCVTKNNVEYFLNSRLINYSTSLSGPYTFFPSDKGTQIGELQEYALYEGPIVQIAYSKFCYLNQFFTQLVILSTFDSFELEFELNAPKASDIFLRFDTNLNSSGWFYSFNSADLIRRHYVNENEFVNGSNQYPINGALLIDLEDTYLSIFPSFPLGAGMPDESSFELNLHRQPEKSDGLGLMQFEPDGFSVTHSFLITLEKFSFERMWKDFISHKASPSVYFLKRNLLVTDRFSGADDFNRLVTVNESVGILPSDECKYVSSAGLRDDEIVIRVLNLCGKNKEKGWLSEMEEVNAAGFEKEEIDMVKRDGKCLEHNERNNSGKNVVKYKMEKEEGMIGPFELRSFKKEAEGLRRIIEDEILKESVEEVDVRFGEDYVPSVEGMTFVYVGVGVGLFLVIRRLRNKPRHLNNYS